MITYINKGRGLFVALEQAGLHLAYSNGAWSYNPSDEVAIQNIINSYNPLPYEQAQAIAQINTAIQAKLAKVTAGYPDLEVATWPQQVAEAQAFTANSAAATPILSAISTASGQTVAALAATVMTKTAAYTAASGAAVGQRIALSAPIYAATDWTTIAGLTATALAAIGV